MKQVLCLLVAIVFCLIGYSQGITLMYKGGSGDWGNPVNWIQVNVPVGQTPIQRAPTQFDDVIFSSAQSGLSAGTFFIPENTGIEIGGTSATGNRCRSLRISNMDVSFTNFLNMVALDVYTNNGGRVIIDSGAHLRYGEFLLHGGNPTIWDLEISNSSFGSLFSHASWSNLWIAPNGRARLINSTLGGHYFGTESNGGELFVENCTFATQNITLGDNSIVTLLNTTIDNDLNNLGMHFKIGHNANFVSSNVSLSSWAGLDFYTSGSILNGNVMVRLETTGGMDFKQKYPANPQPNIINGSFTLQQGDGFIGISGDLKISGNFINNAPPQLLHITNDITINNEYIFTIGGLKNYGNNAFLTNCPPNYCHFKLEFFGNTNSNIHWPIGFPIDTLIINKTGCAKVTATNSLYVSGEARIQSGQLVLKPNVGVSYKLVCAGNLTISQGGGLFLARSANGQVANMAVDGNINDYNLVSDSVCVGLSNPYAGNILLYRRIAGSTPRTLNIAGNSSIGHLNLAAATGTDFLLGSNITVDDFRFSNNNRAMLGTYDFTVKGSISNYGPGAYFVTNGSGSLRINNIGSVQRIFPVGPSALSYNPLSITNAGVVDHFKVQVQPTVLSDGTTGASYDNAVVNRTWNVQELTQGGSNVTLNAHWNTADELNGFTRGASYLAHHVSGGWNMGPLAQAQGANPYNLERAGITSFSPFAVFGAAAVVPVRLLNFSGSYQNKAIDLLWSTSSELNTKHFILEESVDQLTFVELAYLDAAGNSSVEKHYGFKDEKYAAGANYYRLKIVHLDGSFTYSSTITLVAPVGFSFSIYPNPVAEQLTFRLSGAAAKIKLMIIDSKGVLVKEVKLSTLANGITAVPVMDLAAGVYIVQIYSEFAIESRQFIKK